MVSEQVLELQIVSNGQQVYIGSDGKQVYLGMKYWVRR